MPDAILQLYICQLKASEEWVKSEVNPVKLVNSCFVELN